MPGLMKTANLFCFAATVNVGVRPSFFNIFLLTSPHLTFHDNGVGPRLTIASVYPSSSGNEKNINAYNNVRTSASVNVVVCLVHM